MIWMKQDRDTHSYIDIQGELDWKRWFVQYMTYQVAYSHMIPISLYVIIEMLKLLQASIINKDVKINTINSESDIKDLKIWVI